MGYPPLLLLPLLVLLPVLLFHLTSKKLEANRKKKKLPPGPPRLPIIGNLHQLGASPLRTLCGLSKKYGDVMLLHFGTVPTVFISSAEAAKEILKTHDLKTCSRPLFTGARKLSYNYLDLAFSPYGDYWREMRKICVVEVFCAKRVESFQFVREEEVSLMIDSISKSCSCSSSNSSLLPVDLSEKILSLTANVACRVSFGKRFQGEFSQEKFQQVSHESFELLERFSAADFFPSVGWIIDRITGLHARLEKNAKELDGFYQKMIDDHTKERRNNREEGDQEYIIDVLLELERSQNESADGIQFSKDHTKAILMNIFLPGLDTVAVTLVWAMAELVKNPRVMKKAQEEIRRNIGSKTKVSESDINKLGYLQMVIKETLRLHPPGPLLPRESMSQFNINGNEIYPKSRIYVNVWLIARDPKIWKNPEEFYPERFMDNHPINYQDLNNFDMLAFGGGRRICPGLSMGMALVELALANLLLYFDWKLPYNMRTEDINMEETKMKESLVLVPIRYQFA